MKDKLLIITKLKKTYEYIDKSLENYPHRYIELRNKISDTLFDIIEISYEANEVYNREEYISKCLAKLSMVDYYLKISYKKEIISKKKFESIAKHLLDIKGMMYSWRIVCEESK